MALAGALMPRTAQAQAPGFALNRYEPADRGSEWFSVDSLDLRGDQRVAAGLTVDWAHDPLVAYDEDGEVFAKVVSNQVFAHLGADLVFGGRIRVGLSVPVLVYQSGEPTPIGGVMYETADGASLGDARLSGDLRLFGEYGDPITTAIGVLIHVPIGSREAFASDGQARIVPRAQAAGEIGRFVYAGRLGINLRAQGDEFAGEPIGSEVQIGVAGGVRLLDRRLVVGPELYAATVVSDGESFFDRRTTPFEALLGAHYLIAGMWRVGAGVGPGLSRGFGAPDARVLASVDLAPEPEEPPPPPPPDTDGDGIIDYEDACPRVAGEPNTEDPKMHGCPPPPDTDGDGIIDAQDACPEVPGEPNAEDPKQHGCPPPDTDGDTILDRDDACPQEAGDPNPEDPTKHGCPPPPDKDGDTILDEVDACPEDAGEPNDDPKKHGCPKVQVTAGEIKIFERVEFETGKAVIRPESESILVAVADILKKYTDIVSVQVQGHTDSRGNQFLNKRLSKARAKAVVKWLVEHGVEERRLIYEGYGPSRPIDSNETEEGRQNNRRVEFHILEREGDLVIEEPGKEGTQ